MTPQPVTDPTNAALLLHAALARVHNLHKPNPNSECAACGRPFTDIEPSGPSMDDVAKLQDSITKLRDEIERMKG